MAKQLLKLAGVQLLSAKSKAVAATLPLLEAPTVVTVQSLNSKLVLLAQASPLAATLLLVPIFETAQRLKFTVLQLLAKRA